MKETITFLLPCRANFPSGGFKIIFEYANRLSEDGFKVNIVMPAILYTFRNKIAGLLRYPYYSISKRYVPYLWFNLNRNIDCYYVWSLEERNVIQSDIYIATSVETSYFLVRYKKICKKFYFIQDFEAWDMTAGQVMKSYQFPLKKITIAPWLVRKICDAGSNAVLIPNGFDFSSFSLVVPIEKRKKYSILMLYHKDDRKRCVDSIRALKIVKEKYPELEITMFGVPPKPRNIPFNFTYYRRPDKKNHNMIYNNAAIFVAASKAEGMALPPAEAMQCGCALCCTDIDGFSLYAKKNITALLSPVYDYEALASNIITLIENDKKRIEIATNGYQLIKEFTWNKAYNDFKKTLLK
jgi:glycosyltransferase involved in cell wall biosynthesis